MRPVLILLRKSILSFSRARAAIMVTFVVPIALVYLFGHVFGLYSHDSGPSGIPVAVVNASSAPAARDLVEALKAEPALSILTEAKNADGTSRPLTEADVRQGLRENWYRFALILPVDLVSDTRFGIHLRFLTNPRNEIEAQMVNGLLQKTIFSRVPQLLEQSLQAGARRYIGPDRLNQFNQTLAEAISRNFGGDEAVIRRRIESGNYFGLAAGAPTKTTDPSLRRLDTGAPAAKASGTPTTAAAAPEPANGSDLLSRLVRFDTEQVAGKEVKNPMAARLVGGYAVMFLLFAVSGSIATMFEERRSGIYHRLLSAPVRPGHILWARFLFGVLLGLAQIGVLFLAGRLFFGLEIFSHFGALFGVALASAAACSAFGMFVGAVSPSHEAANGIATLMVLSMSAIGGAWFPVSFMPGYIQTLSKFTLVYWSVEGFTDVLWAGRSLLEVLPKIGVLSGIAVVVMSFSVWRFNRSRFFG